MNVCEAMERAKQAWTKGAPIPDDGIERAGPDRLVLDMDTGRCLLVFTCP